MASSCVRLSVDGNWFPQQSRLGFGGLLRDSHGRWLAGYSGGRSNEDPCLAEILAVWRGLLVAWDMGFRVIVVRPTPWMLVSNSCADALAKMGACSNSDYEYWLNPPSPVLKWLLKDSTV
ncbi:Ribonuclease H-like superfamily [Sesbania bispinosa]|nr:Ribonuclease H-like superfamily [Sesbania bispinosa]